jgi:two-component system response regulator AtoC
MKTTEQALFLHILLVDQHTEERPALASALRTQYRVTVVSSGEEGVRVLKHDPPALIIIDAGERNMATLSLFDEYDQQLPLTLVGPHRNDEYAEDGFKCSALKAWIEQAIAARQLHKQVANLASGEGHIQNFGDFVTCNADVINSFHVLRRVAETDVSILITGESGTGKELIARGIHEYSGRKTRPFVAINSAAIPEHLLETELFGYEKGAFTGAAAVKVGKLEYAAVGTVFLDEIGDMPLLTQAKLLRALQERTFERVGGHQPISFLARVVAATNKNLHQEVQNKTFRDDLLYRLNTVHVRLPPLRERREDIPILIDRIIKTFSERYQKQLLGISPWVANTLQKYDWPGNVRELLNTIQHAVLLADGPRIELKDLPAQFQHGIKATILLDKLGILPLSELVEHATADLERQIIVSTLDKFNYSKLRSAYYLGINRKTLYRKMKTLDIQDHEGEEA